MKKRSDAYLKVVEWSEEDQCYIGTSPGLMMGGVHGSSEEKVYKELCQTIDEWVAQAEADGIPLPAATANKNYSGKFVLRVGEDIHKVLSIRAMQNGEVAGGGCGRSCRWTMGDFVKRHDLSVVNLTKQPPGPD